MLEREEIRKIMKIRITNFRMTIIAFFLCIYVVLASLVSILIPNTYFRVAIVWIALLSLLNGSKVSVNKSDMRLMPFILVMLVGLIRGTHTAVFDIMIMIPFVLVIFVIRSKNMLVPAIYRVLETADILYAIITFVFFFNSGLYAQTVKLLFPSSSIRLLKWYKEGCMAGLTSHYTVNGILLATGLLLVYSNWYAEYTKKKKIGSMHF